MRLGFFNGTFFKKCHFWRARLSPFGGGGINFCGSPAGFFSPVLKIFDWISFHFLYLNSSWQNEKFCIRLKNHVGDIFWFDKNVMDCEFTRWTIWFATKNHLGNGFLFQKKNRNFECIRKDYLICNEKPLRKLYFISRKRNFWMHSKKLLDLQWKTSSETVFYFT